MRRPWITIGRWGVVIPMILLSLARSEVARAECAPDRMTRIVFKNETPNLDPDSFVARPKVLYRYGPHHARLEEVPDRNGRVHGLIVTNKRDTWSVNLAAKTGRHIVDKDETYDFRAPVAGRKGDSPEVREMEFGCEIRYMRERGVEPMTIAIGNESFVEYKTSVDEYVFRLLVYPDLGVPFAFGLYENGTLIYYLRYLEYQTDLEPDENLFARPEGIAFEEAEQP